MCTYTRTVFECQHQAWGRRLKLCTVGEEHQAGDLPRACALRMPHGLHSRRVPRLCDKCSDLDLKRSLLRAKLDECRELCRRHAPDADLEAPPPRPVAARASYAGAGASYARRSYQPPASATTTTTTTMATTMGRASVMGWDAAAARRKTVMLG